MWDNDKQDRFNARRGAERRGTLTDAERTELAALTQELDAREAPYLTPATERIQQEREALGSQNRQVEALLRERQADRADVRSLVAELEARDLKAYHEAGREL